MDELLAESTRPDSWTHLQQGVQQGLHGGYATAPSFGAGALRNQAQGMLGAAEEAAGNAARRLTGSALLSVADMKDSPSCIRIVPLLCLPISRAVWHNASLVVCKLSWLHFK